MSTVDAPGHDGRRQKKGAAPARAVFARLGGVNHVVRAHCRTGRIYRCPTVPKKRCCPYACSPWNGAPWPRKREGLKIDRDVQRSPARPARAKLVTQATAAACGDERKNLPGRTNRQRPARQGVVRRLRYGSRRPPLDIPALGTVFRARRIVHTDRCRPGQRRTPGIRTDRSRER
jgi:hypothetical protein